MKMILYGGGVVDGLSPENKRIKIDLKERAMSVVDVNIQLGRVKGDKVSVVIFEDNTTFRVVGNVIDRTDIILRDVDYKI